jgi:hypothetical protein
LGTILFISPLHFTCTPPSHPSSPLLGKAKDEVFERYAKCPLKGLPLYGGPVGEPAGGSFAGTFERKEKHIWILFLDAKVIKILSLSEALATLKHTYVGSFFLDPEDIRKLSLEAIWNFGRNRSPIIWYRIWGTMGLS